MDEVQEGVGGKAPGEGSVEVLDARPVTRGRPFEKGNLVNPGGKMAVEVAKPPERSALLRDLDWAYKNLTGTKKPPNEQCRLFREDFLADREKTLKLLMQLQKDYKEEVRDWRERHRKKVEAAGGVGAGGAGTGSGVAGSVALGPDDGEERVRDMMQRLLHEASNHGSDKGVSELRPEDESGGEGKSGGVSKVL
jgi:hypothetical protein